MRGVGSSEKPRSPAISNWRPVRFSTARETRITSYNVCYTKLLRLRYSQNSAVDMFDEVNTGNNLPAQIDLFATEGMEYP